MDGFYWLHALFPAEIWWPAAVATWLTFKVAKRIPKDAGVVKLLDPRNLSPEFRAKRRVEGILKDNEVTRKREARRTKRRLKQETFRRLEEASKTGRLHKPSRVYDRKSGVRLTERKDATDGCLEVRHG